MVKNKKTNMADTPPPSEGRGARLKTTVAVTPAGGGGDPPVNVATGTPVVTTPARVPPVSTVVMAPAVSAPMVSTAVSRAPVISVPVLTTPVMSPLVNPTGVVRDYDAEFLWGQRFGEQLLAALGTQGQGTPSPTTTKVAQNIQNLVYANVSAPIVAPADSGTVAGGDVNLASVIATPDLFKRYLEGLVRQAIALPSPVLSTPVVPISVEEDEIVGIPGGGKDKSKKSFTKLKPYDNRKEPFESYFQRFESHARHYEWDDDEKMFQLETTLGDAGGTVLWDSGEFSTYERLASHLKSRFGSSTQAERFALKLTSRRRKPGETIHELYEDCKRLMALAHPSLRGSSADSVAMQAFAAAVDSDAMR